MDYKESAHFDKCSAPLCLEARDIDDDSIWYTDEDICTANPSGGIPNWIKQQRKIVKRCKGEDIGFFTLGMLKRNCIICTGIKGIDGDRSDVKDQIKRWFRNHKEKRILTETEKNKLREKMLKIRKKIGVKKT